MPYSSWSFSFFFVKYPFSDGWVLFLLQTPSTLSRHVRLVLNLNAKKIVVSLGEEEDRNPIIEYRKWQAVHALLTAKDIFCVLCQEFGKSWIPSCMVFCRETSTKYGSFGNYWLLQRILLSISSQRLTVNRYCNAKNVVILTSIPYSRVVPLSLDTI